MSSQHNLKRYNNIQFLNTHLKTLLLTPKFCSLCLENNGEFYPLSKELAINDDAGSKPLRDVVDGIFNFHIEDIMPSGFICEKCTEKIIHCYTFIENTKKLFRVIEHCITDISSKVSDISHELEDNDNREYYNANVMIVVEYDAKTYNEIDELTSVQNAILSDVPLKPKNTAENFTPVIENVRTKKEIDKMIHDIKKETRIPIIKPIPRVVKRPRILKKNITREEIVTKPENVPNTAQGKAAISKTNVTPNVSLKDGKLLVKPLLMKNAPTTPNFNTYTCPTCNDIFTSYRKLKEHEKSKHSSVIYKCRLCNEKCYNTQQYLDMHYKAQHLKERCRFCSELFNTDDGSLDMHLSEKHRNAVSPCLFCNLVYYNAEELETHIKSTHIYYNDKANTNNKTQCIMCLRSFVDDQLVNHKCKFACLDCPVVQEKCIHYNYLMSYREQVLNHASTIKCIDCDYTTKRKELLLCHVNREHLDHHPFTCSDCRTQFYTKQSLKTHIIQFHQEYKCEFCDTDFNKNTKFYQSHREICKSETRKFACDQCVASFNTEEELAKHSEINHSELVFPCTLCKKEFPDAISLGDHHNKIHSKVQLKKRRKFIECTLCDINFRNLKEMFEHEKLHDASETFPCKVCPKSFKNLRQVYIHKQRHYSERVQCPECSKLIIVSRLNQHKEICQYTNNHDLKHICEHCGKELQSDHTLRVHLKSHCKPIPCDYCNKMLKPDCLRAHIVKKHSAVYKFDEPTDGFTNTALKTETKGQFGCEKCEYSTKSQLSLENHINRVHLKIKPFTCEICKKSFCGKVRLLEHMKIHSEKNPCFCPYCGKKYANKVCLKMHVRRHTGEYPYECNICFEKFRSSSIMKTHRLKKHQDKTIACPLCDAMYHLATEMRFHVKKAHWTKKEPFDYTQIIPAEYHHLFEDRRLQKLGDQNDGIAL